MKNIEEKEGIFLRRMKAVVSDINDSSQRQTRKFKIALRCDLVNIGGYELSVSDFIDYCHLFRTWNEWLFLWIGSGAKKGFIHCKQKLG